jgi:hypothetical protein
MKLICSRSLICYDERESTNKRHKLAFPSSQAAPSTNILKYPILPLSEYPQLAVLDPNPGILLHDRALFHLR